MPDELVLIHQMGKVGSTTLLESIRGTLPVYHTHFLNEERLNRQIQAESGSLRLPGHLRHSLEVRDLLRNGMTSLKALRLITATRDPVERNISAYFQNVGDKAHWGIEELITHFLDKYPHDLPLRWFDWEIEEVFHIDVYSYAFPHKDGYLILERKNISLMIIRLEDMDRVVTSGAVSDFLGVNIAESYAKQNVSKEKGYSGKYEKVKESIQLPREYLDEMYLSGYMSHFYTPLERELMRKRWESNT